MKKKYYYDCPIQALYMHINFGVKFGTQVMTPEITKIYVLPESEHIFEPKEGDLGIYDGGELWRFITGKWYFRNDFEDRTEDYDFITNIIKRDNKHFFNPKEEN